MGLVAKVPVEYLEALIAETSGGLVRGHVNARRRCHGSEHSPVPASVRRSAWEEARRRLFMKLYALVATKAQWPVFLSARVTPGTWGDSPELEGLLELLDAEIELGNLALDEGYQSRKSAERIEDRGGGWVMELKANASHALAKGHPAWKRMVLRQRNDRRSHRCRYRRWTVVKGVFVAMKRQSGEVVFTWRRHDHRFETLCRVALCSVLGLVYHLG